MRKYLVTAVLLVLLSFSMIAADKYDSELVVIQTRTRLIMDPAMYQISLSVTGYEEYI